MAVQSFVVELIEGLLKSKDLGLTDGDIRFYDKGTTAGEDEDLDSFVKWKNARFYNEDSNVFRSTTLIVRIAVEGGEDQYVNFPVGPLYRDYRMDGDIKGVLKVVETTLKRVKANAAKTVGLLNRFGDLEAIRDHLILRPFNYDNNEKVLADGIYRRIGDMALVLYISLGSYEWGNEEGSKDIMSAMVHRSLFKSWGLDGVKEEEELLDYALENTMRLQKPVLCLLSDIHSSQLRQMRFMEEDLDIDFGSPLSPMLTTEQEVNGAIAAFFPAVQERLYQMTGGKDYYLVFTSIDDVHIHTVDGRVKVSTMRTSLDDTNRVVNSRDQLLSRQIYRYDGVEKKLVLVQE